MSLASFRVTPAGATTKSSRLVIAWQIRIIITNDHGFSTFKSLCKKVFLLQARNPVMVLVNINLDTLYIELYRYDYDFFLKKIFTNLLQWPVVVFLGQEINVS